MQFDLEEEEFDFNLSGLTVTQTIGDENFNVSIVEESFVVGDSEDTVDVTIVEEAITYNFAEFERVILEPDEVQLTKRVDFISDTLFYKGEAPPGTSDTDPYWRIRRTTLTAEDDVTEVYADGDANFDNVWSNRASLSYS